jgi:hypothetical protein
MIHREDGKRARVTRGFYEEIQTAKKNKKKVPKVPEGWFVSRHKSRFTS